MPELKKVTVSMTPKDINNVAKIREAFGNRSNAGAFSTAMSLAALTVDAAAQVDGQELILRNPKTRESRKVIVIN